jgi:hypothetical protein
VSTADRLQTIIGARGVQIHETVTYSSAAEPAEALPTYGRPSKRRTRSDFPEPST